MTHAIVLSLTNLLGGKSPILFQKENRNATQVAEEIRITNSAINHLKFKNQQIEKEKKAKKTILRESIGIGPNRFVVTKKKSRSSSNIDISKTLSYIGTKVDDTLSVILPHESSVPDNYHKGKRRKGKLFFSNKKRDVADDIPIGLDFTLEDLQLSLKQVGSVFSMESCLER